LLFIIGSLIDFVLIVFPSCHCERSVAIANYA
jgi:hypothetical protein